MKNEWENLFLDIVEQRFHEIKSRNKRFSSRSFARMAQISPGAMSLILKRSITWSLSTQRALEVLTLIKADTDKINHFAVLSSTACIDAPAPIPPEDEHIFLTDPYYMPICLAYSLSEVPSIDDMSQSLQISAARVQHIVEDLLTRGHLVKTEGQIRKGQSKRFATGDGPSNKTIQQHHLASLNTFRDALEKGGVDDRDISSLVLTGNRKQVDLVKNEIRQFYQRVHAIINAPVQKDEVFRIFVGFMPLKLGAIASPKEKSTDEI